LGGKKKTILLSEGYIGRPSAHIGRDTKRIKETLANIGVEFVIAFEWTTRQECGDFYKKVDFLVLGGYGKLPSELWQITPTKMINAAAFGVPSMRLCGSDTKNSKGYYTQFKKMEDLNR